MCVDHILSAYDPVYAERLQSILERSGSLFLSITSTIKYARIIIFAVSGYDCPTYLD